VKPNPSTSSLLVSFAAVAWASLTAGCGGDATSGTKNRDSGLEGTGGALGSGGVGSGGSNADAAALGTGGAKGGAGGTAVPDASIGTGGVAGQTGGQVGTGGAVGSGGKIGTGGATGAGGGTGGKTGTGAGGKTSTGGSSGTGGVIVDGGDPGSGGKTGTGGATGTGGTTAATGGTGGQGCPGSSAYVGNSAWPDQLVVTAGAKYCGHFKEIRAPNLEQEYAAKAKLTIAAGTYRLSNTAGTYDFALPVCFERLPGLPVPAFAGAGRVQTIPQDSTVNTRKSVGQIATQPLVLAGSGSWNFSMRLSYWSFTGPAQPPMLDGSILDHPATGKPGDQSPGYLDTIELCDGTECDDQWEDVIFEACNPDYPLQRHTITFDGGQMVLDMRITGEVGGSVMTAAFTGASGTLDGTAFAQTDYWKLIYSADHHHFIRNFAVLFDAPIGGACGLKVLSLIGNNPGESLPEVDTINCDLSNIAARTVASAVIELP
jgi:hypothetical protein